MTEIIIEKLSIVHFKGIKELTVAFDPVSQDLIGDNGTGKTSIADAIHWLLFGKNSLGEADFGIKPLDKHSVKIPKTETDVTGTLLWNQRRVVLRHVFKEVWRKKQGSEKAELTGNTHEYYVDSAPHTLAEYKAVINRMVEESIFPLITNPHHFNRMPWQKRREILLQMGGDISNSDLARTDPAFAPLVEILLNKTLAKYKQEVVHNKKSVREQLEAIPARIDEVRRGMPKEEDYETLEARITSRQESLDEIDEEISNVTKAMEKETELIRQHQTKIRGIKVDMDAVTARIKQQEDDKYADSGKELDAKRRELRSLELSVTAARDSIDALDKRKLSLMTQINDGRDAWKKINAEQMPVDENEYKCPSCHQDLPAHDIEAKQDELRTNFAQDKARRLQNNVDKGSGLKRDLTEVERQLAAKHEELVKYENAYDEVVTEIQHLEAVPVDSRPNVQEIILANPEYIAFKQKLADLEGNPPATKKTDLTDQQVKRRQISVEMDGLKKQLNGREQRQQAQTRIDELSAQEKEYSRQLVELEGKENLIERFTKAKIDTLTERINDKFALVRFKMFNYLQNGGVEETCEAMIDGVPYSDLNTASKTNAGIDVINALSEHFTARAPIIIDNRESTIRIQPTKSQVISLIAREGIKVIETRAGSSRKAQAELAL